MKIIMAVVNGIIGVIGVIIFMIENADRSPAAEAVFGILLFLLIIACNIIALLGTQQKDNLLSLYLKRKALEEQQKINVLKGQLTK
jgi:hypothetical protein